MSNSGPREKRSYRRGGSSGPEVDQWPPSQRAVYDAALELFFERGFANTSVSDIVDHADLTKGAMYHYFSSKDELLSAISDRYLDFMIPRFEAVVVRNLPADEALGQCIGAMFDAIATYRMEVAVFFEEWRHMSKEIFAPSKAKRDRVEAMLVDIVDRGVADGTIRGGHDSRLVAFAVFGMCAYAQYWWKPDGALTPGDMAGLFSDMIIRGLGTFPTSLITRAPALDP